MQLRTPADGQEQEMSMVSYPTWSASTSRDEPPRADPSADGKYNHWWPSQAYHCTFCPRVFRTAQALGGHMNIHRRERAFANDTAGTHFHTRRLGDNSQASNSILSRSSSHPTTTLDQLQSSLFSSSSSTPPAPYPVNCKDNCYANRRIAVTPDVTTVNFFAPIQDMTYHHHRVGWNQGGDAAAKLEESSSGHTISDPLSWLFSQLPPPGSVSTLQQRQQSQSQPQQQPQQNHQQQQQQQQCRGGGNILTQKNLAKPYHRAVAVRRSVGHLSSPFSEQHLQARESSEIGGNRSGEQEDGVQDDGDEELDLELRL